MMNNEDGDLGHLVTAGTASSESTAEIGEHLASLGRQVTGTDEVALTFIGFLAGDEYQLAASRDDDMGLGQGSGQVLGIDGFERH
jgi:hypothetical protein